MDTQRVAHLDTLVGGAPGYASGGPSGGYTPGRGPSDCSGHLMVMEAFLLVDFLVLLDLQDHLIYKDFYRVPLADDQMIQTLP